ncbi:unnamed protein product [Bursaphelenchus okinawaensis]|uniref:Acyl-CoA thioesterase-like C-terminal domain-containing protein n=1 Tax=Bursaphelenchus okinawaensis TaxID=465554 RepID=A0A811LIQ0_9BILA|nr:unnamed protein product [Bursaphelenchus okinawaensis]CAG9123979.1 unnamed protein product [Bursaphelenchus okinawaensis]
MSKNEKRGVQEDIVKIFENFFNLTEVDGHFTATPPHHGGAFNPIRLFGGQAIGQAYLAATKIRPDFLPLRMDFTFLRPGTTKDDIDYMATSSGVGSHYLALESRQGEKVLNTAKFRLARLKYFEKEALQPVDFIDTSNLPCPYQTKPSSPFIATTVIDKWLKRHGFETRFANFNRNRPTLFEGRLIRFYDFENDQKQSSLMWMRLSKIVKDSPIPINVIIPLVFSDFILALPSNVILDQEPSQKSPVMSSLEHQVVFHSNDFDAKDFFLVEQQIECSTEMVKINGKIATRHGRPVMSFTQQAFFQELIPNQFVEPSPKL